MDGTEHEEGPASPPARRKRASVGLVASGLVVGAILAGSHVAGAATSTSTPASSSGAATIAVPINPANMTHGPGEALLTDGNAEKAKAAALAAVPGGTIIRVETDSAGSPYEAHMRKSDGSFVTVKLDSNFKVTSIQAGFGAGGPGPQAPNPTGA